MVMDHSEAGGIVPRETITSDASCEGNGRAGTDRSNLVQVRGGPALRRTKYVADELLTGIEPTKRKKTNRTFWQRSN